MRKRVIGLIQTRAEGSPGDNLRRQEDLIRRSAATGAQIICTQELFRSAYFCQTEDYANFALAEPIPSGKGTQVMLGLARELGVVLVASLFEKRAEGLYHNAAVVVDADGSFLGIYRKMHIPDDPLYYEKFYFTPGDTGFRAWKTRFGTIGVLICWDQWYPEAARLTSMQGAEVLFYPTAIGWHPKEKDSLGMVQKEAWETIQRSHAIANGCYVASVNRIGHEKISGDGIEFWGGSFVCDPMGVVVNKASANQEEIVLAEIDLDRVEDVRVHWPFFRDRRIDGYGDLVKRWGEI